jgi:nucleotide-binding universal stress UspA family protein
MLAIALHRHRPGVQQPRFLQQSRTRRHHRSDPIAPTATVGEATPMTEPRYRHVLVPLDGSEFAAAAVPTARALAERFAADLQAVSVAEAPGDVEKLRSHAAAALGSLSDEGVSVVVAEDVPAAIERRAAELGSCLVCLSTHGHGRFAGAVIGSVARSLLESSPEPIVAVGPSADRPRETVPNLPAPLSVPRLAACVDGSAASESVVPAAAAWAEALGMSLTILTVAEPSPPPVRPDATWRRHHGPDEDADRYVERLGEQWRRRAAVPVDTHVVYDPIGPGEGIQAYQDQQPTGLIAVTTHARTGLERVLLGAGAAAMVHWSRTPALVVPLTVR